MGKETTVKERELVIHHFKKGKALREIAEIMNRSRSTIQHVVERYKKENAVLRKITKSIKGIFIEKEETWILRQIKRIKN